MDKDEESQLLVESGNQEIETSDWSFKKAQEMGFSQAEINQLKAIYGRQHQSTNKQYKQN